MECLIWIITKISRNIRYVPNKERFYEKSIGNLIIPVRNEKFPENGMSKMQSIYVEKVAVDLQQDLEKLNTDLLPKTGENESNESRYLEVEWIYNLTFVTSLT